MTTYVLAVLIYISNPKDDAVTITMPDTRYPTLQTCRDAGIQVQRDFKVPNGWGGGVAFQVKTSCLVVPPAANPNQKVE